MRVRKFSLQKLCTLSAFAVCFSVIFGVGTWFQPILQVRQSASAPVVIATVVAQPLHDPSVPDPIPLDAETATAATELEVSVPNPTQLVADMMAVPHQVGMTATAPNAAETIVSPEQSAQQQATFVGVWAPDGSSCSLKNFRDGLLPTVMKLDGASAGDTFCSFKNLQHVQTGWRMDAVCSNKQEQWSTRVHLSVNGDRMIWKSKRGAQAYTRCVNDLRMAQAH